MNKKNHLGLIILLSFLIPFFIFCISLLQSGERTVKNLETIHGIPYPSDAGKIIIEEDMAHADVNLQEPVLAKQATFVVSFDPGNASSIDFGVRENDFWLSYQKYPLFRASSDQRKLQTKEITVPLSNMFQDTDRSLDIMFFADSPWSINAIRATVTPVLPTLQELKAYIKSVIKRERAL